MESAILIYGAAGGLGGLGGLAGFLADLKRGRIKNNRCVRKAALGTCGGMIVGPVMALLVSALFTTPFLLFVSFAVGIAWEAILDKVRKWITDFIGRNLP